MRMRSGALAAPTWSQLSLQRRFAAALATHALAGFASATPPILFSQPPIVETVTGLLPTHNDASVSDIAVADFDRDGRQDIAVAWYATSSTQMSENLRRVTLFRGVPGGIEAWNEFDLYRPDFNIEVLSVFRNGTAEVTPGDFDGDGDVDFAVTAFFGDEIWFFENRGAPVFEARLKFAFGTNSPSNFLTPPESAAADFDGDGRQDLVYLADPIQHVQGKIVHFWRTSSAMANIYRVNWEAGEGARFMQWTRGLAVDDFDADGRPDLCFTGTVIPPNEEGPVVAIWRAFNTQTRRFVPSYFDAPFLCADVATYTFPGDCAPSILLADQSGQSWSQWIPIACAPDAPAYSSLIYQIDFAQSSPNRGFSLGVADLDGDGHRDVVSKQKLGQWGDARQIECSFATEDLLIWERPDTAGVKTSQFSNATNPVLRPHNLVVADVVGNRLPDVIAGFGRSRGAMPGDPDRLVIVVWPNGCNGDVTFDGRTNDADLTKILQHREACAGHGDYVSACDLNRDGCVDGSDYQLCAADWGCQRPTRRSGDVNCDGKVDSGDLQPFVLLLLSIETGTSPDDPDSCSLTNADVNGDGLVNISDAEPFVMLLMDRS